MLPAIGSFSAAADGRSGMVVAARPIGEPDSGRQLVALRVKTVDQQTAAGETASRVSGLAPQGSERLESSGRARDPRAIEVDRRARSAARLPEQLSPAEREVVDHLRQRDAQVRQEENTHAAIAGDLAGPISYVYQRGPDGRQYAVGGSVGIQAQVISGDPDELRRVGAKIAAAAVAPTNPSAQDFATARLATRMYAEGAQLAQSDGADRERLDQSF